MILIQCDICNVEVENPSDLITCCGCGCEFCQECSGKQNMHLCYDCEQEQSKEQEVAQTKNTGVSLYTDFSHYNCFRFTDINYSLYTVGDPFNIIFLPNFQNDIQQVQGTLSVVDLGVSNIPRLVITCRQSSRTLPYDVTVYPSKGHVLAISHPKTHQLYWV